MKGRNGPGAKGAQGGESVTDGTAEDKPAAVSETAKQAGEVQARWAWTEPAVWTERMLTALGGRQNKVRTRIGVPLGILPRFCV